MSSIYRVLALCAACVLWFCGAAAQELGGLARVDPVISKVEETRGDRTVLTLGLSQGVPWRVFTLTEPDRLVLDFREADWSAVTPDIFEGGAISEVRLGTYLPGWTRMVARLARPVSVAQAELAVDGETGAARLSVRLDPVEADQFAADAGAPRDPRWDLPEPALSASRVRVSEGAETLHVVLDPGHGGVDPGAEVDGLDEKTLMLTFARELQEALLRSEGFRVSLTRDDDYFVSLERRIAIAHELGADVFLSLHADALSQGTAHGATVYMLSRDASDAASARLAERHDRDDILAGVDLSGADDRVTGILLDLARQETQPRTHALAAALIDGMAQTGGPMNRRPLRSASFSVLKAADIPSVLIEIGFLSSPRDLANLRDPQWRQRMAEGIRDGLQAWRVSDAARRALSRQ